MKPIRIVVVDDHTILRDGIVSVLNAESDFEVVGVAGSASGALAVVRDSRPDVLLIDYSLPDGTGVEVTKEIVTAYPETNVVLLTLHEEDELLFAAVRNGAKGYLLKKISAKELLVKLRGLYQGDVAFLPAQTRRILSEFARSRPIKSAEQEEIIPLTDREVEVLQLIVTGASNQEIGVQLHISIHTVKNHLHSILKKLQVATRHQAAEKAVRDGLVRSGKL